MGRWVVSEKIFPTEGAVGKTTQRKQVDFISNGNRMIPPVS